MANVDHIKFFVFVHDSVCSWLMCTVIHLFYIHLIYKYSTVLYIHLKSKWNYAMISNQFSWSSIIRWRKFLYNLKIHISIVWKQYVHVKLAHLWYYYYYMSQRSVFDVIITDSWEFPKESVRFPLFHISCINYEFEWKIFKTRSLEH